jgi:mono/diheme cytochrome c family protein
LLPIPRNLTESTFTDRALSEVLWAGKPGSSMPAWNDLPAADLRAVVTYLRSLSPTDTLEHLSAEDHRTAANLYRTHCAVCHGPTGAGNGSSARVLTPEPTNFRRVQPSREHAERVLEAGVLGTAMPRWKGKLNLEERRLLTGYVRSLFNREE